jgi:hypothetical protein
MGHPPPDGALAALGPAGMIVGLIIAIGALILLIFIAQYIYKDAIKRSLNAELWLLIVFLAPIISWIVYFIVRNAERPSASIKEAR